MVWPSPIGSGRSLYARLREREDTNQCRGTFRIASSTLGSLTPRASICRLTISRRLAAASSVRGLFHVSLVETGRDAPACPSIEVVLCC